MKTLNLWLISVIVWLPFCSSSMAMGVSVIDGSGPEYKVIFYQNKESVDWVGDAVVGGGFYASGNIFMEYDYFLANQNKGLEFELWGKLFFLPEVEGLTLPGFDGYSDTYDIAYTTDDAFIDYWITADSNLEADYFFSKKNIYVIDRSLTPVPPPAAAWLFASALLLLAWRRRVQRG